MSEEMGIIISLTLYKTVSLFVGLTICYLGFKLFMSGIWGHAGDFKAEYGDNKLVLKSAAPGTFFALFGAMIIAFTVWKGLEFNKNSLQQIPEWIQKEIEGNKLPDKVPF